MQGIEAFLDGFAEWTEPVQYPPEFSAKVYKISRDEQGNRLTHLKVTGGTLKVKDLLCTKTEGEERLWKSKIRSVFIPLKNMKFVRKQRREKSVP